MVNIKRLIVIIGFLFATTCYAQEASKNRVFTLSDFSGGIATKLDNNSTPEKFARIAENIRLNTVLKAIDKRGQVYLYGTAVTSTEAITGMHRLYLSSGTKQLIITQGNDINTGNDSTGVFTSILALTTGDYRWNWLTWHNLAIGGDGYNQPVKYNGTLASYLGTCAAVDNGAGAGPNGTYLYKVSFYTASYEVLFNVPSNSITVTDNDIDLSMIPIGPDSYSGEAVTGRKVYRTDNGGATYKLLSNGTIANNTATTLTDSDADGALGAAYPAGTATWTPPKGKFYLVHKNRLFIANNPTTPSRIYYSKDGSHELFETSTDYFDIRQNDGDEITGIFNLLGILTISKTNTWQKLYTNGDDPVTDWEISDPFSFIGCDTPYSAKNTPIGILYMSAAKSGIYVFNGQSSILKSEQATPEVQDVSPSNLGNVCGEYNNNIYYLAYASKASAVSYNNRVLVYDMLSNSFTKDTLNVNVFCSFTGGTDGGTLFGGASDSGKVYSYGLTAQTVIHSKTSDFSGTFDDMRYLPVVAGGDPNSPVLELAWDVDINNMAGTINAATGDINRPDTGGTYISPVLSTTNATSYDKLYWNETIPAGNDVTFSVRSGASSAACQAAGWTGTYTNPSGTDISGATANSFTQYRITMSTDDIDETPNVTTAGGYTVKLAYNTLGSAGEASIALHWQTGFLDFGLKGYTKALRKIFIEHAGTNGTLTVLITNEYGESDTFTIDLATYPSYYEEYFTNGILAGKKFKIDITNSDLNAITIKSIWILYDAEPMV
jgi:hypothetical protein